jgi:drug/metabolite transporter (DMT)-like permease
VLAIIRPGWLRLTRQDLYYLVGYGLVLAVFNGLWTISVALNGAAIATVLAYSSTGFAVILGWSFLKERLDPSKAVAVILSLAGCTLVAGVISPSALQVDITGIAAGVLTGLMYAVYTLLGRSASKRGLNPWATLAYTFGFAAVFLLIFNLIPGGVVPGAAPTPAGIFALGNSWVGWGVLILLAAGPTVTGFGLYNVSLTYLPSSIANLIVSMEPAITAVIAYFWLGERLTGMQILGSLMILGAVVILRLYEGWLANRARAQVGTPEQSTVAAD